VLVSETRVHPESVRWFLHTPQPNIPHVAEIGYYNKRRGWSVLAASNAVRTPPAGPSADRGFELATLAPDGAMERHDTIKEFAQPGGLPGSGTWRDEHNLNSLNPAGTNSLTDASGSWGLALSSPGIRSWSLLDSPSSPQGGACPPAFRLVVDAELTVYGSTDPAAVLQIGNQTVPLAADGSFRVRFAFPDGLQVLPIKAISAETGEQRTVELRFSRHTEAGG
jgi:hypothetical protein